jgi:hypothetical protein
MKPKLDVASSEMIQPSVPLLQFLDVFFSQDPPFMAPATASWCRYWAKVAELFFRETLAEHGLPARELRLGDLNNDFVLALRGWQQSRGLSSSSVNQMLSVLAKVVRWAIERGCHGLELITVERLPASYDHARAWSSEQIAKILAAASECDGYIGPVRAGTWWPALLRFILDTGCARTLVMHTPTSNLNLEAGTVVVPDTRIAAGQRPFTLSSECLALLREFNLDDRIDVPPAMIFGDWPFDYRGAGAAAWVSLNRRLRRIFEVAGVPEAAASVNSSRLWAGLRLAHKTFLREATAEVEKDAVGLAEMGLSVKATPQDVLAGIIGRLSKGFSLPREDVTGIFSELAKGCSLSLDR